MTPNGQHDGTSDWIRRVRLAWRVLTGGSTTPDEGRPTLVAVSGGADSAALAVALAGVSRTRVVLCFVAHDLRPSELVSDDLAATRDLARRLGRPLVVEAARTSGTGNGEAEARKARYAALAQVTDRLRIPFVATGHHSVDQFETMVGALLRGGSPAALRGIHESRSFGASGPASLIRPMLSLPPDPVTAVCRQAGYDPRRDHTNADPDRMRAMLRSKTLCDAAGSIDGLGERLARTSRLMAGAGDAGGSGCQDPPSRARTSASRRSSSETCDTL